ncbi:MAG: YcaO-like family protein [Paracoccaceae bacterium]
MSETSSPASGLSRTPKRFRRGTHRAVAPARTLERVRPILRDVGVTRVANVTGLDRIGIPVVAVIRPNARSLAVAQGKGLDLDAARASGVMEAIEGFHAETAALPLRLAREDEVAAPGQRVPLAALPRLSGTRIDPARRLLWVEGRDLMHGCACWVPFETVHTDYTLPPVGASGCLVASSNGLASGNHLAEAIAHGLAEVIERDALTLWNARSERAIAATRVDLDAVACPDCAMLLRRLRDARMAVAAWDVASDVGLPAYYCLIVDELSASGHSGAGAGCHPDAAIALARAITEAAQVRLTYIAGARDDLLPGEYAAEARTEKTERARRLMALPDGGRRRVVPAPSGPGAETFEEELDAVLERLAGVGVERVVCVDLTKPEIGLPVARLVVTGLEGPDDHADYAPGARALARADA